MFSAIRNAITDRTNRLNGVKENEAHTSEGEEDKLLMVETPYEHDDDHVGPMDESSPGEELSEEHTTSVSHWLNAPGDGSASYSELDIPCTGPTWMFKQWDTLRRDVFTACLDGVLTVVGTGAVSYTHLTLPTIYSV